MTLSGAKGLGWLAHPRCFADAQHDGRLCLSLLTPVAGVFHSEEDRRNVLFGATLRLVRFPELSWLYLSFTLSRLISYRCSSVSIRGENASSISFLRGAFCRIRGHLRKVTPPAPPFTGGTDPGRWLRPQAALCLSVSLRPLTRKTAISFIGASPGGGIRGIHSESQRRKMT